MFATEQNLFDTEQKIRNLCKKILYMSDNQLIDFFGIITDYKIL
jgi:hypothetical protein